jgi:hypothetical protein
MAKHDPFFAGGRRGPASALLLPIGEMSMIFIGPPCRTFEGPIAPMAECKSD